MELYVCVSVTSVLHFQYFDISGGGKDASHYQFEMAPTKVFLQTKNECLDGVITNHLYIIVDEAPRG